MMRPAHAAPARPGDVRGPRSAVLDGAANDPERQIEDWLTRQMDDAPDGTADGPSDLARWFDAWPSSRSPASAATRARPCPSSAKAKPRADWTKLRVARRRGATIVRLTAANLTREDDLKTTAHELDALLAAGHHRVVVNFAAVERISSPVVGVLARAVRRCEAVDGGQLRVCGLRRDLAELLDLTGLAARLPVYDDEAAALAAAWPEAHGPRPLRVSILEALARRGPSAAVEAADRTDDGNRDHLAELPLWLVARRRGNRRRNQAVRVTSGRDRFVIGRDPDCDFHLDDPLVSRRHAAIGRLGEAPVLLELGSTNGTRLNGRPIHGAPVALSDGDRITIGSWTLEVVLGRSPGARPPGDDEILGWLHPEDRSDAADPSASTRIDEAAADAPGPDDPIRTEVIEGVLVVTPTAPSLTDDASLAGLRERLTALAEGPWPRRVVLRLDRVGTLSSRAVGLVVAHGLRLNRLGGALRVCGASAPVLALLEHVRLPMLVPVFEGLDEAVLASWE